MAKLCSSLQYFSTIAELINTSEQSVNYYFRTYPCMLIREAREVSEDQNFQGIDYIFVELNKL